ncbi:hypothetical protein J2S43_006504 [Catenuloplanes nepalensis]|uniref:Uncharacterized protein n=1 Tax=Catenuloplanes nepalensis TaxID=587533 RepID=A0ABT9N2S8_9ACTN|nr:hypothetical protein [Catenuloplanes nepalensis]MDP9797992.1 hypothetical protein [Catenuloplanes nepalensis]
MTASAAMPRRRIGLAQIGLLVAVLAAVALIVLPGNADRAESPAQTGPIGPAEAWPGVTIGQFPGNVSDGPAFSPSYFLDATTAIGTAPSPDGAFMRLVRRAGDGTLRELRRLPYSGAPQFGGFATDGTELAWAESLAGDDNVTRTEMWAMRLPDGEPRRLTADTGDVVFFNSEYDMLIAEGALYWAEVAPGDEPATLIRSVPLAGGDVTTGTEDGAWAMTKFPWLVSAESGQASLPKLRDWRNHRELTVPATGTELVTCGSVWCRVLVISADGPARTDLMRPDGSERRRMAGGAAMSAVTDVALLDRFEVLTEAGPDTIPTSSQILYVYDIATQRTVRVADAVGMIQSRNGVLWWSTGADTDIVWHTLPLTAVG